MFECQGCGYFIPYCQCGGQTFVNENEGVYNREEWEKVEERRERQHRKEMQDFTCE